MPRVTARALPIHQIVLAGVLCLVAATILIGAPSYANPDNLASQARFMSELGLIALAMTLVLITGGIDLSVGAIFGLVAVVFGLLFQADVGVVPAALGAIAVGVAAGCLNGFLVTVTTLPPFIVTLGTLALYRGIAEGLAQGRSARGLPEWFHEIGQGFVFGLPGQVAIFAVAAIAAWIVLERTPFGQSIRTTGYNDEAALFSGVDVKAVRFSVYALAGLMSSIAAMLYVSRVTTTRSDMGLGLELEAVTVVVLGGTSVFGGKGSIGGTVLALVLVQLLKSGLSLMGVRGDGTVVVIGAVLIATVLLGNLFARTERA